MLEPRHLHSYSAVRHIAQGYAMVILGLTASLFLYAGTIEKWSLAWWLPAHVLSVALLVAGGWWWWKMPPLTANWVRVTEQFSMAALLQLYMIPFVVWWRSAPQVPFLTANVMIAIAGIAWLLLMLGAIIAETGRILADRTMMIEGRITLWLGPPLLLIPAAYATTRAVLFFLRAGLPFGWDAIRVGMLWPAWIGAIMILGPVLLLSASVETRLRCLRATRWLKAQSTPGA